MYINQETRDRISTILDDLDDHLSGAGDLDDILTHSADARRALYGHRDDLIAALDTLDDDLACSPFADENIARRVSNAGWDARGVDVKFPEPGSLACVRGDMGYTEGRIVDISDDRRDVTVYQTDTGDLLEFFVEDGVYTTDDGYELTPR